MSRTLFRKARWPGDVAIEDGIIVAVGDITEIPGDKVIECPGDIITPGLINTHHHLYQWITRGQADGCNLFAWLTALYPIWSRLNVDDVHAAALVGLSELATSGCTTAFDHHYIVPNGDDSVFDAIVTAAGQVGIRLYLSRGSMDLSEKDGGLPPDKVVEDRDAILTSTERIIAEHHDGKMVSVVIAPCSPFSVTSELMVESAELARQHKLRLHTHLCETIEEQNHCLERFGRRPVEQLEKWGWLGDDVWLAHGIHITDDEIGSLSRAGTGVAHCPSSNARLGAGLCKVTDLRAAGVPVGLGVDGAASNEQGALFPELRQALYTARLRELQPAALMPIDTVDIATVGGAACLGRPDLGRLQPGAAADLAIWPAQDIGDIQDPITGLVLGPDRKVRHLYVAGKSVVSNGELLSVDLRDAHRRLTDRARRLWD